MNQEKSIGLGLFLLSAAILTLEVLQMRILALQMWYHYAYMVVSLTLLGFAAAGTVVTLWPRLAKGDVTGKLAWSSIFFGISTLASYLIMLRMKGSLTSLSAEGTFGTLALFYSIMVFPYFFAGLAVTAALSSTERIHVRYFVNLLGSALGAWVFIAAISPLGGERLLVLCAALGFAAALGFKASAPRSGAFTAAIAALLGAVPFFVFAPTWLEVEIGPGKQAFKGEHVERRWTPLTCIDVLRDADQPSRLYIFQDGTAGTVMYEHKSWVRRPRFSPELLAYIPHLRRMKEGARGPKVAVIGIGGGMDLRNAVDYGASSVLGIEINREMMRLAGEDYAEFNGRIYEVPGISVELGEGRSTLRRLDERFDIILTAGADTYTAPTTASFVLSESYLYTKEAIRDFLDHLAPGGTLGMTRIADEPPYEMLRLFAMGLEELRRRGIGEPSRHAVILKHRFIGGAVFSLDPIHKKDLMAYLRADKGPEGSFKVLYVPGMEKQNEFTDLALAYDKETEEDFFSQYPANVRPVTDDSPFYFNFHRLFGSWEQEPSLCSEKFNILFPVAPELLSKLLLQAFVLVLILVLLPLFILKRSGLEARCAGRHLIYFLGLGVAFMFLEISAIQRLALFLGHPTYSVTVVLFCFLFFAGLGSLFSGRIASSSLRRVLLLLTAVILVFTFVLHPLLDSTLHLPLAARIAVAIAVLAPMNFLMGMPFPLGLSRLKLLAPDLVPWALAANGGASVIGSILCVLLAMETGFTAVSILSAAIYFMAMLAATTGSLHLKNSVS